MFRVTRTEKGKTYSRTEVKDYIDTYTQPIHNYIIARLYHFVWEKLTWRLWRVAEKIHEKRHPDWFDDWIPYTNRQDITCYFLHQKNRKVINNEIKNTRPRT